MPQQQPAELLRILTAESDLYQGKPLYEAIVDRCRSLHIAGATVFRGMEGFGETAELHRAHLLHRDQPVAIVIVDSPANIARLIPEIEPMLDTGMMALSSVTAVRIQKREP